MQIEVINGGERRRRWSVADKDGLIAKTLEPGATVSGVARQHGIHPSQLYSWRRQMRTGLLGAPAAGESGVVPVRLRAAPESPTRAGLIEIVLAGGRLIRVDREIDGAALHRVLDVLEGR